jgi:hypothetical protein
MELDVRDGNLICTARIADFQVSDLVVVQVDAAVYVIA